MIIYGRNSVKEFLVNNTEDVLELYVSGDTKLKNLKKILDLANFNRVKINSISRDDLNKLCKVDNHQGIAAKVKPFRYTELKEILDFNAKNKFILILDHIEDPHNLGAIIRTANFLGVDGIVIPKDRAVGVTPTVIKVSSGATSSIPISQVSNLNQLIKSLKKKDYWIIGSDVNTEKTIFDLEISDLNIALLIGNEGRGISQKIIEKCDFLVSILKKGKVESLNASVAAGILIYSLTSLVRMK